MKPKLIPLFSAYLAFCLALNSLREVLSLGWWVIILLALGWSLLNQFKIKSHISGWLLNGLALVSIFFSFFLPHTEMLDFLIYPLLILILIKFIGQIKTRDLWQIYTLTLFLLCVSALYNFSLNFAVILLSFTWISLIGLCFLNAEQIGDITVIEKPLFYFASGLTVATVFISICFFIFLPRSPYTLFSQFGLIHKAKTGFTNNISLKDIQEIREDMSIAFRAMVKSPLPSFPYWRGLVYDTYNDGHWLVKLRPKKSSHVFCPYSFINTQKILLEIYEGNILFGLEYPCNLSILAPKKVSISFSPNLSFALSQPVFQRIEYQVESCAHFPPLDFDLAEKELYLQVPPSLRPDLKSLLEKLIAKNDSPKLVAKKLMYFLSQPPFRYSRQVPQARGDPVLYFLFVSHKGWCEHFASALTLLLRTAGIPARLIGGYCGGEWNELGHYYIVRQKDAHTWVEYWNGQTWLRLDPTPIATSIKKKLGFLFLLKWIDYIRLRWYTYVINYDFSMQKRLFAHLKHTFTFHQLSWQSKNFRSYWTHPKLYGIILIGFTLMLLVIFWRKHQHKNLFIYLYQILKQHGYPVLPSHGGLEIALMVEKVNPEVARLIREFVEVWYSFRYGRQKMSPRDKTYLKQKLKEIKIYLKADRKVNNT